MPVRATPNTPPDPKLPPPPLDEFLIESVRGGDAAALRELMRRYDRLVRYTVFKAASEICAKDPDWLETVAADTWAGFARSITRNPDNEPQSVPAFIVRISKNQVASAFRRMSRGSESLPMISLDAVGAGITLPLEDPTETLSRLELLEALKSCLEELDCDGRAMAGQLRAITERRWCDAAEVLGVSESTLRSRWKLVLRTLRNCLMRKTGEIVAPVPSAGDK